MGYRVPANRATGMGNGGAGKVGMGKVQGVTGKMTYWICLKCERRIQEGGVGTGNRGATPRQSQSVTEAKCVLCGGPIVASEPVLTFDNGRIHQKKKTCDEFRQGKDPQDKPPRNRRLKVKKAGK